MSQFFPETAHHRTDRKAYEEGYERIFGKKQDSAEPKTTHIAVKDGEVVEISEDEAKKNDKHCTAGMCGEFGMSTFNKEAFDANYDAIRWAPERMVTPEEIKALNE